MDNLEKKVRQLEQKILVNRCDECNCDGNCKNKELRESLEEKLKVLKNNQTVLK